MTGPSGPASEVAALAAAGADLAAAAAEGLDPLFHGSQIETPETHLSFCFGAFVMVALQPPSLLPLGSPLKEFSYRGGGVGEPMIVGGWGLGFSRLLTLNPKPSFLDAFGVFGGRFG